MLPRLPATAVVALLSLFAASSARADRLPPPGPCDYSEIGEACEKNGAKGTCVAHTCSRLSYAGGERKSVPYACKRCDTEPAEANQVGAAEEPPAGQDPSPALGAGGAKTPEGADAKAAKPDAAKSDATTPDATTPDATTPDAAKSDATTPETTDASKGLCTVAPAPRGASVLLLGLGLVLLRRRR